MPEISDPSGAGDDPQAQPGARLEAPPTVTEIEAAPAGLEPQPRQIKPIPSKPRASLPGVTNAAKDDDDLFGPKDAKGERDPSTGRFLPKAPGPGEHGGRDAKPGEEPPAAQPKPPAADTKPPAAPGTVVPIKFLGKEHQSIAEVEQVHRTLQGQYRKAVDDRDYGYNQANGWKAAHDRVLAENEQLKARVSGGSGAQAGQAVHASSGASPSVDDIVKDIDTDAFERIAAQDGLPQAGKYLVSQTLKAVLDRVVPSIRQEYQAALAPSQAREQEAQVHQTVNTLIESVAGYKTLDGSDAFPELRDAAKLEEIGAAWTDAGLPPEVALTPQGLINAVVLWRFMKGLPSAPSVNPSARPTSTPATAPRQVPAPGSAASLAADPQSFPPNRGRAGQGSVMERLVASLDDVAIVDNKLGFTRNPRSAAY